MRHLKRFNPGAASLLACAIASAGASADVYKCIGEGGIPVYQESPCAAGKELRNFQTDPPPLTILPAQAESAVAPSTAKEAAKTAKADQDAKSAKAVPRALDASERKYVRIGMSEAEVQARLGHPDMTVGGKNGAPARWTYLPAPTDPETITTLTLAKGTVTGVERKVVKK